MINSKSHGFTLIEIIIVIALVMLAAALVLPRLNFFDDIILSNEVEHLATTMAFLQQKAIATNQKLELTFSVTGNSYTCGTITTHLLPELVQFGFLSDVKGPPGDPKEPITQAITFHNKEGNTVATFGPDGKVTPGTAYLIDAKHRFMRAATCSVAHASYVRKYRYLDGAWKAY